MKTVSKWFGYLDKPERTPELMRRAFTTLRSGRLGPVILAIPNAMATRSQTRRCLRVLRVRYQGRGTAPVLLERRQFGERAHP
jgi:thiamine pyrophosphate-dependent acetolactate synthase large subunit-like protein